jgi:hypothetical protein
LHFLCDEFLQLIGGLLFCDLINEAVNEMLIRKHDLNHGIHVKVTSIHGIQIGVTLRFLYDLMDLAASLEELNTLIFL